MNKAKPVAILVAFVAVVVAVLLIPRLLSVTPTGLVYADAPQIFWTAPTIIARDRGDLDNANVTTLRVQTGLAAKNAVLEGSADVGMVATTPIAAGIRTGEESVLIGTFVQSNSLLRLGTLAESSTAAGANLTLDEIRADWMASPQRIGYVPGTISEIYLDMLLRAVFDGDAAAGATPTPIKELRERVGRTTLQPPLTTNALKNDQVDYLVIWEPFLINAGHIDGSNSDFEPATRWFGPEGSTPRYSVELHLITRPDVIANRREELIALLRVITSASQDLSNPQRADEFRAVVERNSGQRPGELKEIWPMLDFGPTRSVSPDMWASETRDRIELELQRLIAQQNGGVPETITVEKPMRDRIDAAVDPSLLQEALQGSSGGRP